MSSKGSNGCLGILLSIFGLGQKGSDSEERTDPVYPYRVRDQFFSPAERSFFEVLRTVTGAQAIILAKVRLWDVFYVSKPNENPGAQNRIDRKHIDFLLCSPQTMQPIVGIELDDSSHKRTDRQSRDQLVEATFKAAGLPLLWVDVGYSYNTGELGKLLAPYLGTSGTPIGQPHRAVPPATVSVTASGTPLCPKCGAEMVKKVAKRGQYEGQKFYACTNYPNCKTTLSVK